MTHIPNGPGLYPALYKKLLAAARSGPTLFAREQSGRQSRRERRD